MSLKKFTQYKLLVVLLLLLCMFFPVIPDKAYHLPAPDIAKQNFHVIEFNDQGQAHDDNQWQGLAARIAAPNPSAPPELLIFVHGWHHSAEPNDDNFVAFEQFYQQMVAADPKRNLIGLYIGWRGDSVDPFWLDGSIDATSWIEPLDFPTILQRKSVAKLLGKQGLSQLLDKLDALVAANTLRRYSVIGHSLGGAMVLHASKDRIKTAIDNQQDNPNLFLLLNPAVAAKDYRPLDTLLSVDGQKPSMVVLQSKGDFAVKEAFNYIKDGERALGNSWAITHDIDKCSGGNCDKPISMPSALLAHDQIPGCMMILPQSGWKIRARLQARRTVQTCPDANKQAVWVLAVSDEIVSGHNGILTQDHSNALAEVMNMIDLYKNELPADAITTTELHTAVDAAIEAVAEPLETTDDAATNTLTNKAIDAIELTTEATELAPTVTKALTTETTPIAEPALAPTSVAQTDIEIEAVQAPVIQSQASDIIDTAKEVATPAQIPINKQENLPPSEQTTQKVGEQHSERLASEQLDKAETKPTTGTNAQLATKLKLHLQQRSQLKPVPKAAVDIETETETEALPKTDSAAEVTPPKSPEPKPNH